MARLISRLLPGVAAVVSSALLHASPVPENVKLWPGSAPGSDHVTLAEKITERSADPARHDRIYTQILEPSLRAYTPPSPNGVAVIIAPGGAYQRVVIDKEGLDTSTWLNGLGITVFVLKYRLPDEGHENGYLVPVQDAQRAVRVVRANATDWGLDPNRIGFLGYSAGGHVATTVVFHADRRVYAPVDAADQLSARPDFAVFCYAVAGPFGRAPSPDAPQRERLLADFTVEVQAGAVCPPAFIFHADDDASVNSEHALRIYSALKEAGAAAELHVFRRGGHGFGIRGAQGPIARWSDLCEAWLRDTGVLRP